MSDLHTAEIIWREMQLWLEACGYRLRPRYRVGWIPSWISSPFRRPMDAWRREDNVHIYHPALMDATRTRDDTPVMFKKMPKHTGNEKEIALYLASSPPSEDLRNHCVPIEDVLDVPAGDIPYEIIVMPLLRPFDCPRFDTIGECVDFFLQAFEGLQFIHHHHVAHRDCTGPNIMMDASGMFPQGWHPADPNMNREYTGPAKAYYTRTQRPPKYFWIDYGLSLRFDEFERFPQAKCLHANDRTAPEFQDPEHESRPYDPFPTDIYYLGNLVRMYFLEGNYFFGVKRGLDFMKPLIQDMVQDDPAKRPNIDECVTRLEEIVGSLSSWKLRSQIHDSRDHIYGTIYRFLPYWFRRISYIVRRIPPIPVRRDGSK